VGDEDFGRFALTASQVPPNTVFVPLAELQAKVGLGEKVNVVASDSNSRALYGIDTDFRNRVRTKELIHRLSMGLVASGKISSEVRSQGVLVRQDYLFDEFRSEISIRELQHDRSLEIRSPRVFLDPEVVTSARKSEQSRLTEGDIDFTLPLSREDAEVAVGNSVFVHFFGFGSNPPPGLDSLTYFVTAIEKGAASASEPRSGGIPAADGAANKGDAQIPKSPKGDSDSKTPSNSHAVGDRNAFGGLAAVAAPIRSTPYSMVTAIDAPASGFVQAELADDEIQITRWLADDLDAKPGDKLTLRYSVMGERRELIEKTRTFTVLAPIIEMEEPQLDSSWMPDFPNVPDKDSFSKWKPGFPFDSKRIRKKDEEYWEKHRGTPKAFINLKVGQEMWGNRWGNLTSIRYPAGTKREQVERIAAFIDPKALGFRVVNLREQALAATDAPVDFGQLFASFSFFLIAAAAVLTGLLFTFTIEQRAAEAGLLLAVGWTRKQVRRLFLKEGALLALIGATLGVGGAVLYTKAVLAALAGAWSGATGGTTFIFVVKTGTIVGGIIGSVVMALFAMWLASRKLFKHEAAALLGGNIAEVTK
jgi:ABC-type lipoprotein release transport system permease subunit